MNVLFVMKAVTHFGYHVSTIKHLCGRGHRVKVLFDAAWSKGQSDHAVRHAMGELTGLSVDWSQRRNDRWRRWIYPCRELRSYRSYLIRVGQSEFYGQRWKGYLPVRWRTVVTRPAIAALLRSHLAGFLLDTFERLVPADGPIRAELRRERPDVLVASPMNHRFDEEVEYVKAASAEGIPSVVPVLSWDNLTTKGLFHAVPDLLLAWNHHHVEEAVSIHGVPRGRIVVTGAPFFDKWFHPLPTEWAPKAFLTGLGLDPDTGMVLYLGSSANIAQDESWLVEELLRELGASAQPGVRRFQVLVRPHPANARIFQRLSGTPRLAIHPKDGALPDAETSFHEFAASLFSAVATVGINTSGMIDAVLAGRPCLAVVTDRYRATQEQSTHFQCLRQSGALGLVGNAKETVAAIGGLLDGTDPEFSARRRFAAEFARPRGMRTDAGALAARAIELAAQGTTPSRIEALLAGGEEHA